MNTTRVHTLATLTELLARNLPENEELSLDSMDVENIFANIDNFATEYVAFVRAVSQNTSVKKLRLEMHGLVDGGSADVRAEPLWDALSLLKCLTSLEMDGGGHMDRLVRLAKQVKSIKIKTFRNRDVCALMWALKGHPNLEKLDWQYQAVSVGARSLNGLMTELMTVPKLHDVTIHSIAMTCVVPRKHGLPSPESVAKLLHVRSLKRLRFVGLSFSSQHCTCLARALRQVSSSPRKIVAVAFVDCTFANGEDGSLPTILKSLQAMPSLKELVLNHPSGYDPSSLASELFGLLSLVTLKKLHLSHVPLNEGACERLVRGIQASSSLRSLTMTDCQLCNATLGLFADSLKLNKSLEHLGVTNNPEITGSGLAHLLSCLRKNTALKIIDVYGARQDTTGGPAQNNVHDLVVAAIKSNYGLEELAGWKTVQRAERQTEHIFKLNKAGRSYLIEGQQRACHANGVDVLSKVRDDADCLFAHLVENPSLIRV